ncbi:GH43 family beta-xylosidase [Erythrobacter lutimaris]|nr:GH43 family beta-xylosidase [Alteriqipengyuania lutimaris]
MSDNIIARFETPWDTFNLDATSFHHCGVDYLCWAQREPGIETNSNLYLAPLASPTTFAATPVRLTVPKLALGKHRASRSTMARR